jgi:hypothetical protein
MSKQEKNLVQGSEKEPLKIGMVAKVLCGYVYQNSTDYYTESFSIQNNVEQIAAFIMKYQYAQKVLITDLLDTTELETTYGSFIMYCRDQEFLKAFLPTLVPYQTGEKEAPEFTPIDEDEYVLSVLSDIENCPSISSDELDF